MVGINRKFWLAGLFLLGFGAVVPAFGQGGGGGGAGGGGGGAGGGGAGGGGAGGGGSMGGSMSSSSSSSGSGAGASSGGGILGSGSGSIGGGGGGGGSGGSSTSSTNFLTPSFSNPQYEGRANQTNLGSSSTNAANGTTSQATPPGGFGQPSMGTVTSSSSSTGGSRGGSMGGMGGGAGSGRNSSTTSNQQIPTQVAFTTTVAWPIKSAAPSVLQTDLRGVLNRSTVIKDPAAIQLTVDDKGVVVLRGKAVDDNERRLIANMMLLTPGVRGVKNEIQAPGAEVH